MATLNEWFDKVIVINLARRNDRWNHVLDQCAAHDLAVERFEAIDMPGWGNNGCTESHGAVLSLIVQNGWGKTLILEDDFEFRFPDVQDLFGQFIEQIPADWWMLYIGGHYGNRSNHLISKNVIRFSHMKTTSSYGVTLEAAREMAPHIHGVGPIDELYYHWHMMKPCYVFTPRLCVQYTSFSDLQMRVCDNETCMTDSSHEEELFKRE